MSNNLKLLHQGSKKQVDLGLGKFGITYDVQIQDEIKHRHQTVQIFFNKKEELAFAVNVSLHAASKDLFTNSSVSGNCVYYKVEFKNITSYYVNTFQPEQIIKKTTNANFSPVQSLVFYFDECYFYGTLHLSIMFYFRKMFVNQINSSFVIYASPKQINLHLKWDDIIRENNIYLVHILTTKINALLDLQIYGIACYITTISLEMIYDEVSEVYVLQNESPLKVEVGCHVCNLILRTNDISKKCKMELNSQQILFRASIKEETYPFAHAAENINDFNATVYRKRYTVHI